MPMNCKELMSEAYELAYKLPSLPSNWNAGLCSPLGCCVLCRSTDMYNTAYCRLCFTLRELVEKEFTGTEIIPKILEVSRQAELEFGRLEKKELEEFKNDVCTTCGQTISHWDYRRANFYYIPKKHAIWTKKREKISSILKLSWDESVTDRIVKIASDLW